MCHSTPLYLSSVKRHHLRMSHSIQSQEGFAVATVPGTTFPGVFQSTACCLELISRLEWEKFTWLKISQCLHESHVLLLVGTQTVGWRGPGERSQLSATRAPGEFTDADYLLCSRKWTQEKKMQVKEEDRFECYLENSGNQLTVNWRDAERMAQVLVMRHVAPFAFVTMVLYLPCPTQG